MRAIDDVTVVEIVALRIAARSGFLAIIAIFELRFLRGAFGLRTVGTAFATTSTATAATSATFAGSAVARGAVAGRAFTARVFRMGTIGTAMFGSVRAGVVVSQLGSVQGMGRE